MAKKAASAATDERQRYIVNSLARGLRVLECFLDAPGPLRLKELAETLEVEKATLFRYCATLQDRGYLEHDPLTKEYSLGSKVRDLGLAAGRQIDMLGLIRNWLPGLANHYGGTASFGVLAGTEVVYVDRAVTEGSLSFSLSIGARLPATQSSIGRILLANLAKPELKSVLDQLVTKSGRGELERDLAEARKRGFALNLGGSHPDVHSVAVAVQDRMTSQSVGGLNVAGEAVDFPEERLIEEVGPYLLDVAERIGRNEPPDG